MDIGQQGNEKKGMGQSLAPKNSEHLQPVVDPKSLFTVWIKARTGFDSELV